MFQNLKIHMSLEQCHDKYKDKVLQTDLKQNVNVSGYERTGYNRHVGEGRPTSVSCQVPPSSL